MELLPDGKMVLDEQDTVGVLALIYAKTRMVVDIHATTDSSLSTCHADPPRTRARVCGIKPTGAEGMQPAAKCREIAENGIPGRKSGPGLPAPTMSASQPCHRSLPHIGSDIASVRF